MPFGPGTYGPMGGGGNAAPALSASEALSPMAAPDEQALSELVQMLKGGQAGAEKLLQLLSLMASSTLPQMDQQGGAQQGTPTSIQGLLG